MKTIAMMMLVLALGSGCTTTTVGGRMVAGVDLLSIPSYETRAWVPQTPVVRQVCAAADYYMYAWKNTPGQTLVAHLAVLFAGEKQDWWSILPDSWTGDETTSAPARTAALANATVVVTATGDNNSIAYTYAGTTPVIDISLTGDGNQVIVAPQEEEEE